MALLIAAPVKRRTIAMTQMMVHFHHLRVIHIDNDRDIHGDNRAENDKQLDASLHFSLK